VGYHLVLDKIDLHRYSQNAVSFFPVFLFLFYFPNVVNGRLFSYVYTRLLTIFNRYNRAKETCFL